MSVTLTFTFGTAEEAAAFLAGNKSAAAAPAAAPAPAAEKKVKAETKVEKPVDTGPTADEVTAALTAVKEKFGAPAAKAIIAECGFAKLAELVENAEARKKAKAAADAKLADDGEM